VDDSTFYMALLCQPPEWLWDLSRAVVAPECGEWSVAGACGARSTGFSRAHSKVTDMRGVSILL
jgi:hypothetical protein